MRTHEFRSYFLCSNSALYAGFYETTVHRLLSSLEVTLAQPLEVNKKSEIGRRVDLSQSSFELCFLDDIYFNLAQVTCFSTVTL
ncbi:hypothetical protein TNCV_567191 [Trichonephila clavipes]|nr:hypothetical protein TNCV_567191 [Trichonephila clavipes]